MTKDSRSVIRFAERMIEYSDREDCSHLSSILTHSSISAINWRNVREELGSDRNKDKCERAMVEQCIDDRTRRLLGRVIAQCRIQEKGPLRELNGCISTGKEARVYHGYGMDKFEVAVKVYYTSILKFKTRQPYVDDEFRFRRGYCSKNPRKMARTWAEKEFRMRGHIMVMQFIGRDGQSAPLMHQYRLIDPRLSYIESIGYVRQMFRVSNLIHSDLSEFNLLVWPAGQILDSEEGQFSNTNDTIFVIDVGQAVEKEHPCAIKFLLRDCMAINKYFTNNLFPIYIVRIFGLQLPSTRMAFKWTLNWIADTSLDNDISDHGVKRKLEKELYRLESGIEDDQAVDICIDQYLPQSLRDVINHEKEVCALLRGEDLDYASLCQIADNSKITDCSEDVSDIDDNSIESSSSDSERDEDNKKSKSNKHKPFFDRPRNESPESRQRRKIEMKEYKREQRQNKVPKHVKKRQEKTGRSLKKKS
ncbi:hypothetical protein ACOME3_002472 [Neoechinorhynchus agilis]